MNIEDAAYHTVHDYPGGASALAPRMGMKSAAVLNSKVNPNTETHHLTLSEASKLMDITNDYRILQELNAKHGKIAIELPEIQDANGNVGCLMDLVLCIGTSKGKLFSKFREVMADGRITPCEAKTMSKVIRASQKSLARFERLIHACVDKEKA